MSRFARKPRRVRLQPSTRSPAFSVVRDIIWIDMEPLLERERERCERVSEELEASVKKLDGFRNEVSRAFSIWFHAHFGESLTLLRERHSKLMELGDLVSTVHHKALFSGVSERAAYEEVIRNRARQDERHEKKDSFSDSQNHRSDTKEDMNNESDSLPPEFEEHLRVAFEELAGPASQFDPEEYERLLDSFRDQFKEQIEEERRESFDREFESEQRTRDRENPKNSYPDSHHNTSSDSDEARRKQLYRELARKLHPDQNASVSAAEKELWYEVQKAYETKNLFQLETLAALADGENKHWFYPIRSVAKLQSVFFDFQNKLAAAKKALREAKKDPAWDFINVQKNSSRLTQLKRRLDHELRHDLEEIELELERLETVINRWQAPQRRSSAPRSHRRKTKDLNKAKMDAYTGF